MTHEDLRKRAVDWLTKRRGCGVVLSELKSIYTSEIPDAIGWKGPDSTVIEVKISRADFHAQKRKHHFGVGRKRYFLVPSNLVTVEDLGDSDYGLLWASDHQIRVIRDPTLRMDYDFRSETALLVSALRRVRTREFLTLVPIQPDEVEQIEIVPEPIIPTVTGNQGVSEAASGVCAVTDSKSIVF
jgi:hypothetical protein